jgi:phosphoglycolate phosphatase
LERYDLNIFDFINTSIRIWGKSKGLKNLISKNGFAVEDIVYVGDETRDIDAAKKVGVRVAAVTWGYNSYEKLASHNPDYIIQKPQDLLTLCRNIRPQPSQ